MTGMKGEGAMTRIAGRYQPLDAARAGAPQRARDLQTAQTVWLRDLALPPGQAEALVARAQAAQGIFHPSLVTLFDVVPHGEGRLLLAYEYVPAQTVAHVSAGAPLHPRRAAEILTELGDAVAELHARGVAHGGIAQATVLVTMKGKAKLDRVGDPAMSAVREPSVESDLEALGRLLRELVGKPPAGAAGMAAINLVIDRALNGTLTSAATFAAMLRKTSG